MRRFPLLAAALCLVATLAAGADAARASEESAGLWARLSDGSHFALMRHALAPGTGDPADFALGDCSTQRNLDGAGRAQAERTGAAFRANGIERAEVRTSQWCRCRETAELLALGPVEALPSLNSFFRERARREPQTEATLAFLRQRTADAPLVLVTHQVNITALTDIFPRSGEIIVARLAGDGRLEVAGRLGPID